MLIKVQTNFAAGKEEFSEIECPQPFVTGIIDPDWPYTLAPGKKTSREKADGKLSGYTRNKDGRNQYRAEKPLSIDELKTLPIGDVIGGYLCMWTVGPFLLDNPHAKKVPGVARASAVNELFAAWGFEPCTLLTWGKWDRKSDHGYGGVGFWALGNAEFVAVGKRKGWPSIRTGISSFMPDHLDPDLYSPLAVEPKGKHSAKPLNLHRLCEERFPGPRLEIFGRVARLGWTVFGNEAPGYEGEDIRVSLARVLQDRPLAA